MGREEEENTQADQMPALWTLQNMGEDMKDEEFNRYCAEVMQIPRLESGNYKGWSPATDLNQMAEVFDKLWEGRVNHFAQASWFLINLNEGIAQAMREFIESTKGESE